MASQIFGCCFVDVSESNTQTGNYCWQPPKSAAHFRRLCRLIVLFYWVSGFCGFFFCGLVWISGEADNHKQ